MSFVLADYVYQTSILNAVMTFGLGLYLWESILCFCWFDIDIFRGKVKIKWPMALYFVNRLATFCLLACLQPEIAVSTSTEFHQVNCFALVAIVKTCVMISAFCAANVVVWKTWTLLNSPPKYFWLCILALVIQQALLCPVFLKSKPLPDLLLSGCSGQKLTEIRTEFFSAAFAYTTLLYLSCCVISTRHLLKKDKYSLRSHLTFRENEGIVSKLIRSGIFYVVGTAITSLPICFLSLWLEGQGVFQLVTVESCMILEGILTGRQIIEWYHSNRSGAFIFFVGGKRSRPMRKVNLAQIGITSHVITVDDHGSEIEISEDSEFSSLENDPEESFYYGAFESTADHDRLKTAPSKVTVADVTRFNNNYEDRLFEWNPNQDLKQNKLF